jgi:ComF family protein
MQYSDVVGMCQPHISKWVDRSRRWLEELLWPATCILCGRAGQPELDLCAACEADLPSNDSACAICAEPLPRGIGVRSTCGACLRQPPPFQSTFVPFRYAYPLDHIVRGLKFRKQLVCGRVLGELFARRLLARSEDSLPQMMIPVPLAPRRYRERGYNQASELGLTIERRTRIPVRADLVVRQRETAEQAGLDRKARRKNVKRAFAAIAPLRAQHVAILDDVVTTGSTVSELAKVLRRAGAERVEVWAMARAGKD